MYTDVLVVEYNSLTQATSACARLAEAITTGVLDVHALALVTSTRWGAVKTHDGFTDAMRSTQTPRWLASYAAIAIPYGALPAQYAPTAAWPTLPAHIESDDAERLCPALRRPHTALVVELAQSTPLLAMEIIRPRQTAEVRLLRAFGSATLAELDTILHSADRPMHHNGT